MNKIRKEVELCDLLNEVICTHSISGGTGGGMTSKIYDVLEDFDVKVSCFQVIPDINCNYHPI